MSHRELYRDTRNGKISGVCAGLANRFELEPWLVRIMFMTVALMSGLFLVILAYIALSLMLEKQPAQYEQNTRSQQEHTLKSKPWRQGQSPEALLHVLERDLSNVEAKVKNMEAYVTSESFKVNREFSKL